MRSGSDIRRDVEDELRWDPDIDATDIAVTASNGVVTLAGVDERPDPEIARDAVERIKSDLPFAWDKVRVVLKSGWVTLEGEVEWNYQRERAEAAVRRVRGEKGITNSIVVKPGVAPMEIKRKIEEALRRAAEIDASRVAVETVGSEVILRGSVRSWAERQQA